MNKDVLYSRVKLATIAEGKSIVDKALEEMLELKEQCDIAIQSLMDRGTIENANELQDEMADVACVTEQITGERYFLHKVIDRYKFKLERLAYRLVHGGLFK